MVFHGMRKPPEIMNTEKLTEEVAIGVNADPNVPWSIAKKDAGRRRGTGAEAWITATGRSHHYLEDKAVFFHASNTSPRQRKREGSR